MPIYAKNRKYFFLPVNTGYATNGLPDVRCLSFYAARSGHGLHCAIVGNVVIPDGLGSNEVCAEISEAVNWRRLAGCIEERGARPGIQLSSAWAHFRGIRSFLGRSQRDAIGDYIAAGKRLTLRDAQTSIANLNRGTELAMRAGFRHIQLHAAHGYLFSLLLDSAFCQHSSFAVDAVKRWAESIRSAGCESSIRFSMITGDASFDKLERGQFVSRVLGLPFGFFDVTAGFYNIDKRLIYPSTKELLESRRESTLELALEYPDKQIILSGKASEVNLEALPPNVHIGICRDLIANPNFLRDRVMGCKNSMKCHYYSRGARDLTCGRW